MIHKKRAKINRKFLCFIKISPKSSISCKFLNNEVNFNVFNLVLILKRACVILKKRIYYKEIFYGTHSLGFVHYPLGF